MPPLKTTTPKLYAEHEPETHRTINADRTVTEQELPGFLVVGVELNGVRLPLHRLKAGKFLTRVNEAKSKSDSDSEDESGESDDDQAKSKSKTKTSDE